MATPSVTPGPYRPPNWSSSPPIVTITQVPVQGQGASAANVELPLDANGDPILSTTGSTTTTYVFDAVLDLAHSQRLEKTHHPVQTGSDVSTHAYLMPARLVLNVLMSDAVDAFSPTGSSAATTQFGTTPFTGDPSKSVSAYQTLLSLQAARQPLTVTTRLRTYTNMIITGLDPREDYRTITGLRIPVEFEEIFTASTDTPIDSARTNTTDSTGVGAVSPTPVPNAAGTASTTGSAASALVKQYQYPPQNALAPYVAGTPFAGLGNVALPTLPPASALVAGTPFAGLFGSTPAVNVPGAGGFTSVPGQQSLP